MMYLLDTNILSELIKRHPSPYLIACLTPIPPQSLFTSCICVMELRYGSSLRGDAQVFWRRITEEILSRVNILSLDLHEVLIAGDILAFLQKTGQPIGIEDVLIASTALNRQCTLVSANTRYFTKIGGLAVENWLVPF
jgi:tRNA(fMet)-specific endonuclease VapC